jgi:hypothetical protein
VNQIIFTVPVPIAHEELSHGHVIALPGDKLRNLKVAIILRKPNVGIIRK